MFSFATIVDSICSVLVVFTEEIEMMTTYKTKDTTPTIWSTLIIILWFSMSLLVRLQ